MRLIDADALKETIDREIFRHDTIDHVFQIIDDAPTIEPKRGKWVEQEDCWQCSECGDEYVLEVDVKPIDAKMHYCPNCGCAMTKE